MSINTFTTDTTEAGERFGTAEEHRLHLDAVKSDDPARAELGQGYRDGLGKAPATANTIRAQGVHTMGRYVIESVKGTHTIKATSYRDALRQARAWQARMQSAYADMIGPRGGRVRL